MVDDPKRQVREFYNQIGWQAVADTDHPAEGIYQNTTYEDLRPVSREYIQRCHRRVSRHLRPQGRYLLDAGSGPIQYPDYLAYSQGYTYRVCVDISIVALQEARKRIGDAASGGHGMFVVADVAALPFKPGVFEGVVSLHTLHHLPLVEQPQGYAELYRLLAPGSTAVVVNGWQASPLTAWTDRLIRAIRLVESVCRRFRRSKPAPSSQAGAPVSDAPNAIPAATAKAAAGKPVRGTFLRKNNAAWLRREVGDHIPFEIMVWRSVNVRALRALVHEGWGGRFWLRILFWLEERFPHFLGERGQYPLIVIRKAPGPSSGDQTAAGRIRYRRRLD